MRIYLAGPIHNCTDDEAKIWRHVARVHLEDSGCTVSDPMERDYRGREWAFGQARRLVEADLNAIDGCSAMLAYCPKPSVGTSMEIRYAWEKRKLVYIAAPEPWSPWYIYHAHHLFRELDTALFALRELRTGSLAPVKRRQEDAEGFSCPFCGSCKGYGPYCSECDDE